MELMQKLEGLFGEQQVSHFCGSPKYGLGCCQMEVRGCLIRLSKKFGFYAVEKREPLMALSKWVTWSGHIRFEFEEVDFLEDEGWLLRKRWEVYSHSREMIRTQRRQWESRWERGLAKKDVKLFPIWSVGCEAPERCKAFPQYVPLGGTIHQDWRRRFGVRKQFEFSFIPAIWRCQHSSHLCQGCSFLEGFLIPNRWSFIVNGIQDRSHTSFHLLNLTALGKNQLASSIMF